MDDFLGKALNKELQKIKLSLGYNPIMVISTDNENLREFFVKEISELVEVVTDYESYGYGKQDLINKWSQGNILLMDFERKLANYAKQSNHLKYYNKEDWHHVYHALIDYRDWFLKYGEHTMVIVCSNQTRINMCMDAQLRCCIDFFLIDNWLAKPEIFYKDILKQMEDNKNNLLSN